MAAGILIRYGRSPHFAAGALLLAGLLTAAASMLGTREISDNVPVALGLLGLAALLAFAAVFRASPSEAVQTQAPSQPLHTLLITGLVLHVVLACVCLRAQPGPMIDTYTFNETALQKLLSGHNPYAGTQPNIYSPEEVKRNYPPGAVRDGRVLVGYSYPFLNLLWTLPGYLLGDLRLSYVAAILGAAALIFMLRPDRVGLFLALFLLFNPVTLLIEQRSWSEPMVLLLLLATVYTAQHKRALLPVVFGLFLAAKQYNLIALPLTVLLVQPFSWKQTIKLASQSVAVAMATMLPFLLINPHGIWHDLVIFHASSPPREDAISLAVFFPALMRFGPVVVAAFLLWTMLRLRNSLHFPALYGLALLLYFVTGKQAFVNYYFLVAFAFLLSALLLLNTRCMPSPAR